MKDKATNFTELEKICVPSFDEMNTDGRVCYDSSDDIILGPLSNVQMVMNRSLFANWEQPIYYDFDVTMRDELLKSIISAFESSNIHVAAVTCDMGRGKEFKSLEGIRRKHRKRSSLTKLQTIRCGFSVHNSSFEAT